MSDITIPLGNETALTINPSVLLRDYFAAQAMAASWMPQALVETQPRAADMTPGQRIAAIAYVIADHMLQEREQ